MGLHPDELLDMTLWQFNAYHDGFQLKTKDDLALQVQAAYYNAYWNGFSKGKKKSLSSIINAIYKDETKKKAKPIDFNKLDKEFTSMEDLRKNGWSKEWK